MDRGAWWATVHGVAKSPTRLSGFTFTFSGIFFSLDTLLIYVIIFFKFSFLIACYWYLEK